MMAENDSQGNGRWLWWLAVCATGMVVLAAAGAAWYYYAGQRVWTDGADLRVAEHRAKVREVIWAAPAPVSEVVNTPRQEYEPALTGDEETLYFVRGLPGEGADIYVSHRKGDTWGEPVPLTAVNSEHDELGPRVSPDGKFLLFYSDRPGGLGQYDIWAAARTGEGWSRPFCLGPSINSKYNDYGPAFTPDGKRLIFVTNRRAAAKVKEKTAWRATIRQGNLGDYDLFLAERTESPPPRTQPASQPASQPGKPALAFARAVPLEGVNTSFHEGACCVSPAGDFLYFASDRPGGHGGFDLYRCRLSGGRCGEVVNLGPELNGSANEMDPHLSMRGFLIYFSSDRPGGPGGYDLFTAESREVYAARDRITPPRLSWGIWALIVAVALLIPLLLFLRAAGYRHLDLLQKCVAVSLLAHILLTMLMSLFFIYRPILHHVAEAAGLTTAVNLEVAEEVQMRMQIRQQLTEIPVTDLPVSDPTLAELARPRPADIIPVAPETPELNVPHAKITPAPMTIEPEVPRLIKPAPAPEPVSLPEPPLHSETPTIRLSPEAPILQAERRPEVAPETPTPVRRKVVPAPAPSVAPAEVRLAAAPARPQIQSIAESPAGERPTPPKAERTAPAPMSMIRAELDLDAPDVPAERVATSPTTAPAVQDVPAVATQAQTTAPRGQASLAAVVAPPAARAGESLAVAPAVARAAPAAPEPDRPAPAPTPTTQPAPDVAMPPLPGERVATAAVTAPAVQAVQAVSVKAPTASPQGRAAVEALAVPTAATVGRSLAVAAAVRHAPQATAAPVAVDLAAADAPEIKLPVLAHAAAADAEPTPVATSIRAPGELRARRLVGVGAPPSPLAPTTLARTAPTGMTAVSMIRPEAAIVRPSRPAEPDTKRFALAAKVTPLIPLAGPGKLASPDAFFQRSFEQRQKFIDAMGGSKESEKAVARALAYLSREQLEDGHWPFQPGRKKSGPRGGNDLAITGLATLCFLSGGHTPSKPGPYQECVRKGIDYIVARQKPNGDVRYGGDMYSQAIATIAIAEAAAMTQDPVYRVAAIKAGRFIVNAQNPRTGGWRYKPGDPGDTSVLGWQVLALRSVARTGMAIPAETRKLCFRWLDSVSRSRHGMLAGYQGPSHTLPMTAEAVISRIFLGQRLTAEQVKEACDYLKFHRRPKNEARYYYWYYGSLALAQIRNEAWHQWNAEMKKTLVGYQERDGSWDERRAGRYGRRGGKIYATALSALTLQVYYRYLPMYKVHEPNGE